MLLIQRLPIGLELFKLVKVFQMVHPLELKVHVQQEVSRGLTEQQEYQELPQLHQVIEVSVPNVQDHRVVIMKRVRI